MDFSSYDPVTFGLPAGTHVCLGTRDFRELGALEQPAAAKDRVCPSCRRRLMFLNGLDAARERNR